MTIDILPDRTETKFIPNETYNASTSQKSAMEAWLGGGKGVVSLPTGAGKTILAVLIAEVSRPTLVVVPP